MKTITKTQKTVDDKVTSNYFPRIIREFEDHDEPLFWSLVMENIELEGGQIEGHFGLILRDKGDHNNYISIKFEDLEKIISYYTDFKKKFEEEKNTQKTISRDIDEQELKKLKVRENHLLENLEYLENELSKYKSEYHTLSEKIITNRDDVEKNMELHLIQQEICKRESEIMTTRDKITELRERINELS